MIQSTETELFNQNLSIDPTAYELIPARKYVHVVEILCKGERTARWSRNMETGTWHVSEGWKRAGRRMTRADEEYAEAIYQALVAEARSLGRAY